MEMSREEFEAGANWVAEELFNAWSESLDGAADEMIEETGLSPISVMESASELHTKLADMLSTYRDEYLGAKYYTQEIEEKLDHFEEYFVELAEEYGRTKDEKVLRTFAFAVCDVLAFMLNAIGCEFHKDFGTFKEAHEFKKLVFTDLVNKISERYGSIKIEGGQDNEEENH